MAQKKKPRTRKDEAISFSSKDLEGVHTLNDEAIMITSTIYNHVVKRVLLDNGSASDVLYYDAMKKLGISNDQLKPFLMPLIRFGNEEVKVQSVVTLSLTLGKEPKTTTTMVDFMVVKAYNVLLGRPR